MTQNPSRVPAGVPTGGQFATSARAEAAVSLGDASDFDEVGSCPDCGTPMPGRIGLAAHQGRQVDVFAPGSTCVACPHTVIAPIFASDPDDEGYFYETTMEADGTLTCDRFDADGDHAWRLWAYEPGHPMYDDEAKMFHTTGAAVVAGLTARDGEAPSAKPFTLSTRDRLTIVSPSELRVGDTVLTTDAYDNWRLATVTSLDNDHKSTSVELDGDEDSIESVGNDEPFFKVERGARDYAAHFDLDINQAVSDVRLRHDLANAKPGDRLTDADGDSFTLGDSTATRYYDGCSTCENAKSKGTGFFPNHKASDRCQSGGHNHCSCGTCF